MGLFRKETRAASPAGIVVRPVAAVSKGLFRRLPRKLQLVILAPFALLGSLAVFLAGMMVYYTVTFPDPLSLRHREREPVVRVVARDGSPLGQRGGARDYMPLDLLPKRVVDAVVATEDRRFNEHWGLDPIGLVRASFANLRAGRFAQGGSTLTQQLAKNLFLTPERTMARKVEELLLAFWLEMRLTKSEILELYLNHVYFGGGAYGIEAAAQRFFDKSARELSIAEAAVIAGLLKAPSKYSPTANPGAARSRGRAVLAKMRDAGVITAEEEKKARAEVVQFASPRQSSENSGIEYAVDYALEQLPSLVGSTSGEIIVETTIDVAVQRRAGEVVRKELVLQGSLHSADQGAAVVLDTEGAIRALVGGRSHADSQFNRAVKARRQPGSTFKPFVYLAALESGMTPTSTVYDLPISVAGWSPGNESGRYSGAVTLRHALAHSINTVAARLILDLGPKRVAAVARRLGISGPLREEPTLALGASEVSLLDITGAYTAFANGGRLVEPYIVRRVRLGTGRILYARGASAQTIVVREQHLGALNDMLNEAMTRGTGRRAAIPSHPAAGKTGTSQDFRDAWFIGYTSHLVAGVWVGNDKNTPMNKVRGGQLPADIWRQIMQPAHAGKPPAPLPGTTRPSVSIAEPGPVARAEPHQERKPQTSAPLANTGTSPEVLPWLANNRSSMAVPAVETGAVDPANVPLPRYPKQSIDEDLIARALATPALAPQTAARIVSPGAAVAEPPRQALPQAGHGYDNRIIVRPPAGMMSLGGKTQDAAPASDGRHLADGNVQPGAEGEGCGWWVYVTGC